MAEIHDSPDVTAGPSLPLETVIENAHEAFVSIDEHGRIVAWNREAERTFGWAREAVLGKRLRECLIPPHYRAQHDAGLQRFLETGEGPLLNTRIEITALHRNGHEIPVEMTICAIRREDEWTFHAFIHDISERRRAGELQSRLATLVEHSADAIVSRTAEGVVTSWNPGAERLYGYTAEEVVGTSFYPIVPPDRVYEERLLLARVLRGEAVQAVEAERVTKDGRRLDVSLTISPIRDDAGRVSEFSIITRDISSSKSAQRTLAAAYEQLRQADELKSNLVAIASHEIRTPLTSIIGFATTMLDRWATVPDDDKLEFLHTIEAQGQRLHRLTEEMLTLSRIEAGRTSFEAAVLDLQPLVRELADELALGDVPVASDGSSRALADPGHTRQILLNFLANASAYGAPPISVSIAEEEATVVVRVCDRGAGVPPAFASRLFEPFTRARENDERRGAGLGLAIAKGLAEVGGGEVWHEPNHPNGACFCLRLPKPG